MTRKRLEYDKDARLEALEQTVAYLLAVIADQIGGANNASTVAAMETLATRMLPAIAPQGGPIRQAALDIASDAMGYSAREFRASGVRGH